MPHPEGTRVCEVRLRGLDTEWLFERHWPYALFDDLLTLVADTTCISGGAYLPLRPGKPVLSHSNAPAGPFGGKCDAPGFCFERWIEQAVRPGRRLDRELHVGAGVTDRGKEVHGEYRDEATVCGVGSAHF